MMKRGGMKRKMGLTRGGAAAVGSKVVKYPGHRKGRNAEGRGDSLAMPAERDGERLDEKPKRVWHYGCEADHDAEESSQNDFPTGIGKARLGVRNGWRKWSPVHPLI